MADPISGNFDKINYLGYWQDCKCIRQLPAEASTVGQSDTDRSDKKVSPQSTVSISAEARKNAEEAVFNREKVEQIKEAIRNNS